MSVRAARRRGVRSLRRRDRLAALGAWLSDFTATGRLPASLVALVTGLMAFAFLFTPDYAVSSVKVEGMQVGDPREIAAVSGLLGESVFQLEANDAARRIGALPYIEQVIVSVRFPGAASVEVVERRPVMIVQRDGRNMLVASGGQVMAPAGDEQLPTLVVSGEPQGAAETVPPDVVAAIQSIAAVHGPSARLSWDADDGLALVTEEGQRVIFGEAEAIEAKLAVLAAVDEQVDDDWSELDLREPTRPAFR
jgi:cell division septal protein FtsQ